MNRLYCEAENLQVLCKPCHKDKTNAERKERMKK
jgi:5-methylcytosine-specific restriction endonuclease McrA